MEPRKEPKQLAARVSPDVADWCATIADTPTGGATVVLEAAPTLYRQALAEIRGQFTEAEAKLVLDALNGVHLVGGLLGQHLALEVHDAVALNALHRKWGVDAEKLDRAIGGLTSFQRAAVEMWGASFWVGDYQDEEFTRRHIALLVG